MIKGRSCKNPPYDYMTETKWNSLGETLTVKEALDMWWNSIRVRTNNNTALIYKCYTGEYETCELEDLLDTTETKVLKLVITLDNEYDEDADGYPIIYASLA